MLHSSFWSSARQDATTGDAVAENESRLAGGGAPGYLAEDACLRVAGRIDDDQLAQHYRLFDLEYRSIVGRIGSRAKDEVVALEADEPEALAGGRVVLLAD